MKNLPNVICCCGFLAFAAASLAGNWGWGWAIVALLLAAACV